MSSLKWVILNKWCKMDFLHFLLWAQQSKVDERIWLIHNLSTNFLNDHFWQVHSVSVCNAVIQYFGTRNDILDGGWGGEYFLHHQHLRIFHFRPSAGTHFPRRLLHLQARNSGIKIVERFLEISFTFLLFLLNFGKYHSYNIILYIIFLNFRIKWFLSLEMS